MMTEDDPGLQVHLERYRFAYGTVDWGHRVLDVACGCGYGSAILVGRADLVLGFDNNLDAILGAERHYRHHRAVFLRVDLDTLELPPCDVAVSLETVEHLRDPERFIEQMKESARRSIVLSTPIIPTVHMNPYHLHDFTVDQVRGWFTDERWKIVQEWTQADPAIGPDPCYLVLEARRCG